MEREDLLKKQSLKNKIISTSGFMIIGLFVFAFLVLLAVNITFATKEYRSKEKVYKDWCAQELTTKLSTLDKAMSIIRFNDDIIEMFQRNLYDLEYNDTAEKIKDATMFRENVQQICSALDLESIVFFIPYNEESPTGLISDYVYNDGVLRSVIDKDFFSTDYHNLQLNYGLTDNDFWLKVLNTQTTDRKKVSYTVFYTLTNYSKTEYYGSVAISIDKDLLVKNVGLFYGSGNGKVLIEDVNSKATLYSNGEIKKGSTYVIEEYGLKITQKLQTNVYVNAALSSLLIFAVMCVCCSISLLTFNKIYKKVFGEINDYVSSLENLADKNNLVKVPNYSEFISISKQFDTLVENLNQAIQEKSEYKIAQIDAQLQSLQYQLNPHFMFNMIEVFRMRMEANGDTEAGESMKNFGQFLRYNLAGDQSVTLEEEVKMAEKFINLFKFKYGDRLSYTVNLPDELKKKNCIKFILQPLVENSVKYGFHGKSKLNISISCSEERENLVVQVNDDGSGIEQEKINKIYEEVESTSENGYKIGIANVIKRIKLYYGDKGDFKIESEKGKGTFIKITFPNGGKDEDSIN